MPSLHVHAQHSNRKLQVRAADLHKWMDEPSEWAGYLHRFYRHNPEKPPEWAFEKYGFKLSRKIMRNHLELDQYEDYHDKIFHFHKALLIKERLKSNNSVNYYFPEYDYLEQIALK